MPLTPGVTIEHVLVTPEMAADWLTHNVRNRKIVDKNSRALRRSIDLDEFGLSNDAICFDTAGHLQNGQHRLTQVVESGKALEFFVARGLPPENQMFMDTNARRNAAQQLAMLGYTSSTKRASAAKTIMSYDRDQGPTGTGNMNYSHEEIVTFVQQDDGTLDYAMELTASCGRALRGMEVAVITLGYYVLLKSWEEKTYVFHDKLTHGTDMDAGDPVLQYRNRLIRDGISQATINDRRQLLGGFFKSFNEWIEGKKVKQLRFGLTDDWPVPYTEASFARYQDSRARGLKGHATRRQAVEKSENAEAEAS